MDADLYRQLVDAAPDALVAVDPAGTIVLVNQQAERMFGYTREDLQGQSIEILVPERFHGSHAGHRARFAEQPASRPMGIGRELWGRRRDGTEIPIEISLSPIHTAQGPLVAAAIRDVTERRAIVAEARRANAYLRSALESFADAFALYDDHDHLVMVNSEARHLLGRTLEGPVVGRTYLEMLEAQLTGGLLDVEGESREQTRARILAYHAEPAGSLDLRLAGGQARRITERRTAEGGTVSIVADMTTDRAREDELERTRRMAESASEAKSEFLSSMSHELRTPLNAILGFTQLLQRDRKTPLTDRQQERLAHVLRGGEHLLRLIDEVLDLSRIEARRVTISPEPVSVPELVGEVITTLEPMAVRAAVELRLSPFPAGLPQVRADRTRLAQILMNFGSNAVKYGRRGGFATFRVTVVSGALRLSVRDDGIGIPEAHRARIFEPFHRAGQEAGPVEGTGIGLAISRRLAELMEGRVGFETETGVGSEFWVEVPQHQPTPGASTTIAANIRAESALAGPGPRRLVIYVEDNPSNIAFMRELVEDLAIELVTAPTAEIGLELIRARQPSAVIMDINLPGMSGFEATRRLAEWPETRDIPVVALTAAAMPRDQARAAETGFYRYLTKPVKVDELTRVLEELLG